MVTPDVNSSSKRPSGTSHCTLKITTTAGDGDGTRVEPKFIIFHVFFVISLNLRLASYFVKFLLNLLFNFSAKIAAAVRRWCTTSGSVSFFLSHFAFSSTCLIVSSVFVNLFLVSRSPPRHTVPDWRVPRKLRASCDPR